MSEAPRKVLFKQSALSGLADKMWQASKEEYKTASQKPVELATKSLDAVLAAKKAELEAERAEASRTSGFVFGSKIADRVLQSAANGAASNSSESSTESQEKPKTADQLIREKTATSSTATEGSNGADGDFRDKVASQTDRQKEEQSRQLAKTERIQVVTGEEDEQNVFQTACKLHEYEDGRWAERGQTTLRVNEVYDDNRKKHLRIVARTQGTQRVVINSRVNADTVVEVVDDKRLRLTGTTPDAPLPRIFLVTMPGSKTESNVTQLASLLRIAKADDEERKRKRKNQDDLDESEENSLDAKKERGDDDAVAST